MQTRRNGLRTAAGAGCWLAVMWLATPVFAVDIIDDPVQIDDRAAQVAQTANSLCWEMHRYHQQKPDFRQNYRTAKEIWSRANELREALRAGPVETELLGQQVAQMNDLFAQLEQNLVKWGDGDRSLVPLNGGMRTVVTPGVSVNIPFVGVQVGGPRVITEEGPPLLDRRRLHLNSRGSKRSLERELAALKTAVGYLVEDAGVTVTPPAPAPGPGTAPPAPAAGPVPNPPPEGPALGEPTRIVPPSARKPAANPK